MTAVPFFYDAIHNFFEMLNNVPLNGLYLIANNIDLSLESVSVLNKQ